MTKTFEGGNRKYGVKLKAVGGCALTDRSLVKASSSSLCLSALKKLCRQCPLLDT